MHYLPCPQLLAGDWEVTASARHLLKEAMVTWLLLDWRMDSRFFPEHFWSQTLGFSAHPTSLLS